MVEDSGSGPRYQIVTVVYHSRHLIERFLDRLDGRPTIVVDNSATDEPLDDLLDDRASVSHIDSGGNVGFSAAANRGAEASDAEYLVFLNPDTEPTVEALDRLVDLLAGRAEVSAIGAHAGGASGGGWEPTLPRLLVHSVGLHRLAPSLGVFARTPEGEVIEVDWVSGSCLAIRHDTFTAVGGFNPAFPIYMSDIDLGRRLRTAGGRNVVAGEVLVPHLDGQSSADAPTAMWERRGRAWVRYLRATRGSTSAAAGAAILAAGYAARALAYQLMGQGSHAREMRTYLRALIAEWRTPTNAVQLMRH